jgi:hypothetical protein
MECVLNYDLRTWHRDLAIAKRLENSVHGVLLFYAFFPELCPEDYDRQAGLVINVDQQNSVLPGKVRGQMEGQCGLANATLEIDDRDLFHLNKTSDEVRMIAFAKPKGNISLFWPATNRREVPWQPGTSRCNIGDGTN